MRSTHLALFLFAAILACAAAARGDEPGPATSESGSSPSRAPIDTTGQAAGVKAGTPFWLAPKVSLNVSTASVTLESGPDGKVSFGMLQVRNIDPRTFVVTNPAVTPFITGADTGYEVVPGGLKLGALVYADRKYAVKKFPDALAGLTLLRTRMADKAVIDGRFSIVVTSPRPCYVLIALDERAITTYKEYGAPGWLQEFAPTDYKIETDDPLMATANASFQVFARKAAAGRIALGAPCMEVNSNAMYFALFAEQK